MQGGIAFTEYFQFDQELVRERFFRDDRMIRVKQRINVEYRTNPRTNLDNIMDCLDLHGHERVLDVGCGNGFVLLETARRLAGGGYVKGFDIAPGVLEVARQRLIEAGLAADLEVRNADHLSDIPRRSYDRVMANYMMHYVRNIPTTVRELSRLLKPDGRFLLSTESMASMGEMYDVHFAAMREVGFPERLFRASPKARISLENGASYLTPSFGSVEPVLYEDALEFHEPGPFMEFYEVGHNYCCASSVPADDLTPDMYQRLSDAVRTRVQAIIDQAGVFRVGKRTGSFVCTKPL